MNTSNDNTSNENKEVKNFSINGSTLNKEDSVSINKAIQSYKQATRNIDTSNNALLTNTIVLVEAYKNVKTIRLANQKSSEFMHEFLITSRLKLKTAQFSKYQALDKIKSTIIEELTTIETALTYVRLAKKLSSVTEFTYNDITYDNIPTSWELVSLDLTKSYDLYLKEDTSEYDKFIKAFQGLEDEKRTRLISTVNEFDSKFLMMRRQKPAKS